MHNLFTIWPEFLERYEASRKSLETYRQKFAVFLKWLEGKMPARPLFMEDVTRELAEDYARHIFKRKTSARKDIDNLRRIWEVLLPDQERNPWRIGLHLRPPPPKAPCNYRPLSVDEARCFISTALDCAARADTGAPCCDGRFTTGRDKFLDLADAAVFAWHYGMRIGSLASIDWHDLASWRRGWFLHVPPKTRFTKPWPLEIPIVAEVRGVLERRALERGRASCAAAAPLFPALAAEYRRSPPNLAVSVKAIFRAAGIRDTIRGRAQMHSFRASFITQMDEAGAPTGITDAITGHAPRKVHDLYSHARPAALRRWLDRAIAPLT